jgi:hypothetical protein
MLLGYMQAASRWRYLNWKAENHPSQISNQILFLPTYGKSGWRYTLNDSTQCHQG